MKADLSAIRGEKGKNMKQTFEIDWSKGMVTGFLIKGLLEDYLRKIGTPGTVTVTEKKGEKI